MGSDLPLWLFAVFSAIFQSSTFGFAGVLPPNYTSSVMSGQVGNTRMSVGVYGCRYVCVYVFICVEVNVLMSLHLSLSYPFF